MLGYGGGTEAFSRIRHSFRWFSHFFFCEMISSSLVDGAPRGATCPLFSQRVLQRNSLWTSNHLFGLAVFSWERSALFLRRCHSVYVSCQCFTDSVVSTPLSNFVPICWHLDIHVRVERMGIRRQFCFPEPARCLFVR